MSIHVFRGILVSQVSARTNEKTLFHKKKVASKGTKRVCLFRAKDVPRKWRCCMHRVHVVFNAVFRPLDFNEAAIFDSEYTTFDIISHSTPFYFPFIIERLD